MSIYVGNLPHATNEQTVRELFEQYGDVKSVKIIKDRETGRSRGFGFVDMADNSSAENAINSLNGYELEGRKLQVNEARERENTGFGGGNRGGNRGGGGFRGGNRY